MFALVLNNYGIDLAGRNSTNDLLGFIMRPVVRVAARAIRRFIWIVFADGTHLLFGPMKIEANQNPLGIGQIADKFTDGNRQVLNDSRDGDDLITPSELRMLE